MLSFEHVPPQKAFNDARVMRLDIDHLMERMSKGEGGMSELLDGTKEIYEQRGSGAFTLCQKCNNDTGAWYVGEYVKFTRNLFFLCGKIPPGHGATVVTRIKPLRVLKQILVMFCSANGPRFARKQSSLVRYLLNKESRDYPHGIEVLAGLFDVNNSRLTRQHGLSGLISSDNEGPIIMSEISYPPFVFVLTANGSISPDERLQPITFMRDVGYNDEAEIQLNLFTLSVEGPYPGHFARAPGATES